MADGDVPFPVAAAAARMSMLCWWVLAHGVQSVMVAGEESAMAQLLPPDGGVLQLARVGHLAMGPRGSGVHEPFPSVPLMLTERY